MLVPGDRAGQGGLWNSNNSLPSPPPQSFVLKLCLWGPWIRFLASRCQRYTFLFALPPRLPWGCSAPRWGWQVTEAILKQIFLLPPLPFSLYPFKVQEHLGFFPSLGACIRDLNLLLFPVNSPEIKVRVQFVEVSCFWKTIRNTWNWLHWWWWLSFDTSPWSLSYFHPSPYGLVTGLFSTHSHRHKVQFEYFYGPNIWQRFLALLLTSLAYDSFLKIFSLWRGYLLVIKMAELLY